MSYYYWIYPMILCGSTRRSVIEHERIARAAVVDNHGVIWSLPQPARHHDIIRWRHSVTGEPTTADQQGFLTSTGEFLSRVSAKVVAEAAEQIIKHSGGRQSRDLYSEDLW